MKIGKTDIAITDEQKFISSLRIFTDTEKDTPCESYHKGLSTLETIGLFAETHIKKTKNHNTIQTETDIRIYKMFLQTIKDITYFTCITPNIHNKKLLDVILRQSRNQSGSVYVLKPINAIGPILRILTSLMEETNEISDKAIKYKNILETFIKLGLGIGQIDPIKQVQYQILNTEFLPE